MYAFTIVQVKICAPNNLKSAPQISLGANTSPEMIAQIKIFRTLMGNFKIRRVAIRNRLEPKNPSMEAIQSRFPSKLTNNQTDPE